MPVIALTANTTLQYGGSVDTTYASSPVDDIHIGDQNAAYPYHGDSPTNVSLGGGAGERWRALIRFVDLLTHLPAGVTVNSAILRIYTTLDLGDYNYSVFATPRAWVETEASWNAFSAGNNWATAGADGVGTDVLTPAAGTGTIPGSNAYVDMTVTSAVQAIRDGSADSFIIKVQDGDAFTWFTRSSSTDGQRVELIVDYSAEDTTAPSFTAGPAIVSVGAFGGTATATIDETGDIFYVIVPDGAAAPTPAEVIAGTASGGGAALAAGSDLAATSLSDVFAGLSPLTAYDAYFVARDDEGTPNVQASVTLVNFTTTANINRLLRILNVYQPNSNALVADATGVNYVCYSVFPNAGDTEIKRIAGNDGVFTGGDFELDNDAVGNVDDTGYAILSWTVGADHYSYAAPYVVIDGNA